MKLIAIPALASALALAACGSPETDTTDTADTTSVSADATAETVGTVVEVAQGNEDFSTLVTAVTAAGLGETLSGEGPFTVFAPTNAAFAKLPEGTLDTLTQEENKADLVNILTYHVVAGETNAAALVEAIGAAEGGNLELSTVSGGKLTASLDGENVVLTDAAGGTSTITATDVEADNGVIHVIDTVVMPG